MVPQGGGDHSITHRCAGEWATIRLMDLFAERLARADYDVLTPEAEPDYSTPPGLPKGGYALVNFRPAAG
jgi:fatty-acid peroxygenase